MQPFKPRTGVEQNKINKEIFQIAMEQSSMDINCKAGDFCKAIMSLLSITCSRCIHQDPVKARIMDEEQKRFFKRCLWTRIRKQEQWNSANIGQFNKRILLLLQV